MKLYNSLTKKIGEIKPLEGDTIRMYSCGPTVYDHAHIGNLSSFIHADILKRTLKLAGFNVKHVMNFTDVDDKTIKRSQEKYPNLSPLDALHKLTRDFEEIFKQDMVAVGNSVKDIDFVRATDSIPAMQVLISTLLDQGFAYIADDGVYFSIEAYKKSGKTYGQLLKLSSKNTSKARIANDEYDKDSIHDFALWKVSKPNEPSWEFHLNGKKIDGRPGWHIECSAMSASKLGQPFDIHTGGVDLIFPHHENEIAQSTAGRENPVYTQIFSHSEHLLVDGKKMSKSLGNFCTLQDILDKDFDPLAFRLMILQSHYRSQSNFTWDNLNSAQNRLKSWLKITDRQWQLNESGKQDMEELSIITQNDLDLPSFLAKLSEYFDEVEAKNESPNKTILKLIRQITGINLTRSDITNDQKQLIKDRELTRNSKDWNESDRIRGSLLEQGIELNDTDNGTIWNKL